MPSAKLLLSGIWVLLINTSSAGTWACSCTVSSRLCLELGQIAGAPGKEPGIRADPLHKGHGHLEYWPERSCGHPESLQEPVNSRNPQTQNHCWDRHAYCEGIKVQGWLYWGCLPGDTSSSYFLLCCWSWLNKLKEPGVWDSAVVGSLGLSQ